MERRPKVICESRTAFKTSLRRFEGASLDPYKAAAG